MALPSIIPAGESYRERAATLDHGDGTGSAIIVRHSPLFGWQRRVVTVSWQDMPADQQAATVLGDPIIPGREPEAPPPPAAPIWPEGYEPDRPRPTTFVALVTAGGSVKLRTYHRSAKAAAVQLRRAIYGRGAKPAVAGSLYVVLTPSGLCRSVSHILPTARSPARPSGCRYATEAEKALAWNDDGTPRDVILPDGWQS